jgi:hypothetical protein
MMRELARTTGGEYFHADDRLELQSVFGRIDGELGNTLFAKTENQNIDLGLYLLI